MDVLPLEAGDYAGSYKLIGGRVALDFVNTVSWPGTSREHDWLSNTANVSAWCTAVGLGIPHLTDDDLESVRELRRDLRDFLRPLAHGEPPPELVIDCLNSRIVAAGRLRRVDAETLEWVWVDQSSIIDWFAPVVFDAAEIATSGRYDRLKYCPSCDWLFEDQTRNGSRRWCDMADCGSRAKSRDYYHRSKTNQRP